MQWTDEHIERYLRNELPESDKQLLEKALKEDKNLRGDYELARSLSRTPPDSEIARMKAELNNIHNELFPSSPPPPPPKKGGGKWGIIIVSVLMLCGVLYYVLGTKPADTKPKATPEVLFAQNFQPYEAGFLQRGDTAKSTDVIYQLYTTGDFPKATEKILVYLESNPRDPRVLFLLTSCYIKTGKHQQASVLLDEIADTPLYLNETKWYRALNFLAAGDKQNAQSLLKEIVAEKKSPHTAQAEKLLSEL